MSAPYHAIITLEPGKRSGKPTIRGMRITVYDVLSYLAAGMTHQEILDDFPYLTEEDIRACLSYAADREQRRLQAGKDRRIRRQRAAAFPPLIMRHRACRSLRICACICGLLVNCK